MSDSFFDFDSKCARDDDVSSECGTTGGTRRRIPGLVCIDDEATKVAWEAAPESASESASDASATTCRSAPVDASVTCVGCLLPMAAMVVLDEFVNENAARSLAPPDARSTQALSGRCAT